MSLIWQWEEESPAYGSYGNPNQWTVGGGIASLARESAQNSNDARVDREQAEMAFTVIRLTGDDRRRFEEALGWAQLRPHLQAMASSNQVITTTIRDGLQYLSQSPELLLLRVEDRGCRGLTGPEFPEPDIPESAYGNFIKLCRLDLFSGKEQAAGGSFGLGKAVYWRFSRIQTVVFNSRLSEAWEGQVNNRLFGVNQGTVHVLNRRRHKGRGYLGRIDDDGYARSEFVNEDLARRLYVDRPTDEPGTSALIVGLWDPDQPDLTMEEFARDLEEGIAEAFWPLITRGGMRFVVDVHDEQSPKVEVRPERTFTELVHALRSYDGGTVVTELSDLGDVVEKDLEIEIPRRKINPAHGAFTHTAKLVVTLSDQEKDSLENRVCLLRGPEMVVETVDEEFPGITYHAVLLAGLAVSPESTNLSLRSADEFLRMAEPPSHDRWIPTRGGLQTSLASHYAAPYLPNLRAIRERIHSTLQELFGVVPQVDDRPPKSLVRYFRFLSGGGGDTGEERVSKPKADIVDWQVVDGHWRVEVTTSMRNRPEGWKFRPVPEFVGLEGESVPVLWQEETLMPVDGCTVSDGWVWVPGVEKGRVLRATFVGETDPTSHPIPAERSAVDVAIREPGSLDQGDGS